MTKIYLRTCAPGEDSDPRGLIRVFARRYLNNQESNICFYFLQVDSEVSSFHEICYVETPMYVSSRDTNYSDTNMCLS